MKIQYGRQWPFSPFAAQPSASGFFGTFPGGKKSTRIKKRGRRLLEKPPHIKFDFDSDTDPDSDTDLDK
ncbi:MAG: hypothetical protein ACOZBW_03735 [Thermodesulfobacteriota bacterium]